MGASPLMFNMGETRHQDPELRAVPPFLGRSRGPGEMRVLRPLGATAIDDDTITFCRADDLRARLRDARRARSLLRRVADNLNRAARWLLRLAHRAVSTVAV